LGNLLQEAIVSRALSIVNAGIASAQDIDTIVKSSIGRRLAFVGIFDYFDTMGWDLVYHIYQARGLDVLKILKEKIEKGELGVKTGKGFYEWTPESAEAFKQKLAKGLSEIIKSENNPSH